MVPLTAFYILSDLWSLLGETEPEACHTSVPVVLRLFGLMSKNALGDTAVFNESLGEKIAWLRTVLDMVVAQPSEIGVSPSFRHPVSGMNQRINLRVQDRVRQCSPCGVRWLPLNRCVTSRSHRTTRPWRRCGGGRQPSPPANAGGCPRPSSSAPSRDVPQKIIKIKLNSFG